MLDREHLRQVRQRHYRPTVLKSGAAGARFGKGPRKASPAAGGMCVGLATPLLPRRGCLQGSERRSRARDARTRFRTPSGWRCPSIVL